jgi:23S rRNA (adenine2030-N6)-methyltransferase
VNYRHHYHAGNFADVFKHTLLLALVEGLQRKEKGFVYLDTHAGRGWYDLLAAGVGQRLQRQPEWPDGLGRIESAPVAEQPALVRRYLEAVDLFAQQHPLMSSTPVKLYPGSPWLVQLKLRAQDRMVLCERQPEEYERLMITLGGRPRVRVEPMDGYTAIKAHLPPLERRALVLIDPPYEATDEFDQILVALREGLRRLPSCTFAVWYPLTERAAVDQFFSELLTQPVPPCWTAEVVVVGPESTARMKGCGLLVVNPPWKLDEEIRPVVDWLGDTLARSPSAASGVRWLVTE